MTVEYIKAVAAHFYSHHQILGGIGSSIGPGERLGVPDTGFSHMRGEESF